MNSTSMNQEYEQNRRAPLSRMAHSDTEPDDQYEPGEEDANEPLKVLVVDRRGTFSADILRAARSIEPIPMVIVAMHPTHLLEQVEHESPDVVLAAPEEMTTTGLRRLAQIHRAFPKTVIGLTQGTGAAVISMTEAAACGASEVMTYPATALRLRNGLARILDTAGALRSETVVIREVITHAPPAPPAPVAPAPEGTARVFTVTSPTGGCGKTFFATNLAAYLAGVTNGRVLLLDLDLQFGEVSLALGLRPQRTISELIHEESITEAFSEYVVHHSAGYDVLSAPADPFAAELVGPREATKVLEAARLVYDYVVVDTPPSLNEVVLAAFDQSRYLVVMATMDVPSLRNLKVFLETIERLKLPAEDVSCVLNKAEPDNGIDLGELLRVYPGGFAAVLPYSKDVSRSLNVGKPVLMVDPRVDISQKLLEACGTLVPGAEVTNPGWAANLAVKGGAFSGWHHRRKGERADQAPATANHVAAALPAPPPEAYRPRPAPDPRRHEAVPAAVALDVGPMAWASSQETPAAAPPVSAPEPASMPPAPGTLYAPMPAAPSGGTWGPPSQPRKSWVARLFRRGGRESIPVETAPRTTYQAYPAYPFQQTPAPVLNGHLAATGPTGATPGLTTPGLAPSQRLAFAGSRPVDGYAPARRRPPQEAPSTNRKEPRR